MNNSIELGMKVRDGISGMTGIVTGRTQYLSGSVWLHVTPQGSKDGKPFEAFFLPESQFDLVTD